MKYIELVFKLQSIKNRVKNNFSLIFEIIFIIALLEFIFLLIIPNFSYTNIVRGGDSNRDYLIAYHIITFKEFPLIGPPAFGGIFYNSPLYYYILAIFLLLKDYILTLWFVNLIFHFLTIVIVYFLSRNMFGIGAAVTASILFGISTISIQQASFYIWQPWLMQPFINASYLFLFLFYFKKRYYFLLIGIFLLALASAIHTTAFSMVPFYFVLTLLILKQQNVKLIRLIIPILFFATLITLTYLPVLYYYFNNLRNETVQTREFIYFSDLLLKLIFNWQILINGFFANVGQNLLTINNLVLLGLSILGVYHLSTYQKNNRQKILILILICAIFQPILFFSLMQKQIGDFKNAPLIYSDLHYFTPVFTLLIIFISGVIFGFEKSKLTLLFRIVLVILLIIVISPNFYRTSQQIIKGKNSANWNMEFQAADAIKEEILRIQKKEKLDNFNFFQIKAYKNEYMEGAFWNSLEADLNIKFVKLDYNYLNHYSPINKNDYIFLICYQYTNQIIEKSECLDSFLKEHPEQTQQRSIYSQYPFSVYLIKNM